MNGTASGELSQLVDQWNCSGGENSSYPQEERKSPVHLYYDLTLLTGIFIRITAIETFDLWTPAFLVKEHLNTTPADDS